MIKHNRFPAKQRLKLNYLFQQVVPAEYAFVVHTANPVSGAKGELFGEAVVGMGEALVGNQPGRALSFSAAATASQPEVDMLSLPSKRSGLFSPKGSSNVIFRSDSNGEDLEAFAGAGTTSCMTCWASLFSLM